MHVLGRLLIAMGVLLVIAGGCVLLVEKLGLPLGRLPGDFSWRGKNSVVYFPLASSLIVSALLSLLFYILGRFRH